MQEERASDNVATRFLFRMQPRALPSLKNRRKEERIVSMKWRLVPHPATTFVERIPFIAFLVENDTSSKHSTFLHVSLFPRANQFVIFTAHPSSHSRTRGSIESGVNSFRSTRSINQRISRRFVVLDRVLDQAATLFFTSRSNLRRIRDDVPRRRLNGLPCESERWNLLGSSRSRTSLVPPGTSPSGSLELPSLNGVRRE